MNHIRKRLIKQTSNNTNRDYFNPPQFANRTLKTNSPNFQNKHLDFSNNEPDREERLNEHI